MLKNLIKRARKSNKGFTLVELIVVIVILAIIIGVTIGGIYKYVGQSRVSTDRNNISAIESVASTFATKDGIEAGTATISVTKTGASFTAGAGITEDEVKTMITNWDTLTAKAKEYTITINVSDEDGDGVFDVKLTDNYDGAAGGAGAGGGAGGGETH